ncbi:MAG: helix-turn-helix domain-containing protein [Chloroflexi bacterium]|nr:helix-turn-helix domain-containing protein [Chloroflexota bacterium]
MPELSPTSSPQWASLGQACRILQVNEATLRRWADRGQMRSYRTPGGHRRFALEDLKALTEKAQPEGEASRPQNVADAALRHIRRRLQQRAIAQMPWYEQIPPAGHTRLRLFGYRVLTLASDYLTGHGKRQPLLAEARLVGEEYGDETARLGVPLEFTTQAFTFFRNALIEGLQEATPQDQSPPSVYRTWRLVNTITDEVFQGVVRAYDRHHLPFAIPA